MPSSPRPRLYLRRTDAPLTESRLFRAEPTTTSGGGGGDGSAHDPTDPTRGVLPCGVFFLGIPVASEEQRPGEGGAMVKFVGGAASFVVPSSEVCEVSELGADVAALVGYHVEKSAMPWAMWGQQDVVRRVLPQAPKSLAFDPMNSNTPSMSRGGAGKIGGRTLSAVVGTASGRGGGSMESLTTALLNATLILRPLWVNTQHATAQLRGDPAWYIDAAVNATLLATSILRMIVATAISEREFNAPRLRTPTSAAHPWNPLAHAATSLALTALGRAWLLLWHMEHAWVQRAPLERVSSPTISAVTTLLREGQRHYRSWGSGTASKEDRLDLYLASLDESMYASPLTEAMYVESCLQSSMGLLELIFTVFREGGGGTTVDSRGGVDRADLRRLRGIFAMHRPLVERGLLRSFGLWLYDSLRCASTWERPTTARQAMRRRLQEDVLATDFLEPLLWSLHPGESEDAVVLAGKCLAAVVGGDRTTLERSAAFVVPLAFEMATKSPTPAVVAAMWALLAEFSLDSIDDENPPTPDDDDACTRCIYGDTPHLQPTRIVLAGVGSTRATPFAMCGKCESEHTATDAVRIATDCLYVACQCPWCHPPAPPPPLPPPPVSRGSRGQAILRAKRILDEGISAARKAADATSQRGGEKGMEGGGGMRAAAPMVDSVCRILLRMGIPHGGLASSVFLAILAATEGTTTSAADVAMAWPFAVIFARSQAGDSEVVQTMKNAPAEAEAVRLLRGHAGVASDGPPPSSPSPWTSFEEGGLTPSPQHPPPKAW